jgi:hypothetical protein
MWKFSHLKLKSVKSYLSGICQQLEPYFPDIHKNRHSPLVHQTMQGCLCRHGSPMVHKHVLTIRDLEDVDVVEHFTTSSNHNDLLFVAMLLTGFFVLMCLGEITYADDTTLQNPHKVTTRASVKIDSDLFQFFLPSHKADKQYEGNIVMVHQNCMKANPFKAFLSYLASHNRLFPYNSVLWIASNGCIPTCSFFMHHIRTFLKRMLADTQCMQAVQPSWLNVDVPLPSSKQPVNGHLKHFKSIFRKIPSSYRCCSLAVISIRRSTFTCLDYSSHPVQSSFALPTFFFPPILVS